MPDKLAAALSPLPLPTGNQFKVEFYELAAIDSPFSWVIVHLFLGHLVT